MPDPADMSNFSPRHLTSAQPNRPQPATHSTELRTGTPQHAPRRCKRLSLVMVTRLCALQCRYISLCALSCLSGPFAHCVQPPTLLQPSCPMLGGSARCQPISKTCSTFNQPSSNGSQGIRLWQTRGHYYRRSGKALRSFQDLEQKR